MLKEIASFFSDLTGETELPNFQDSDYRCSPRH